MSDIVREILGQQQEQEDQELLRLLKALADPRPRPRPQQSLDLNPWQTDAVTAPDRGFAETLYSGGVGAGKSLTLCAALLRYVAVPGTKVLLCRYNLSDLRKSTLKTLLEPEPCVDGSIRPPLLPAQAIAGFNKNEGIIYLHNASQIICSGCSDPEKIRSITCSLALVEEASELDEEHYLALTQRARVPCTLPNAVIAVTNPKHKQHWLWRRFSLDRAPDRRLICVSSYSNPHIPKAYVRRLERLPEPERQRMLMGEWTETGSLVFPDFGPRHCGDFSGLKSRPGTQYILSQDYGGGSGCAAATLLAWNDGIIACLEEFNVSKCSHTQMLQWMERHRALTQGTVVYDSANAALKLDMENAGWRCVPCIKDIEGSISIVNDRFSAGTLKVDDACPVLKRQLLGAGRDPGTGKVTKLRDWDVIDSFRYGVCAVALPPLLPQAPGRSLFFVPD